MPKGRSPVGNKTRCGDHPACISAYSRFCTVEILHRWDLEHSWVGNQPKLAIRSHGQDPYPFLAGEGLVGKGFQGFAQIAPHEAIHV